MNFRDVGVKKMDEAFSRDKMWIFCLIYCGNSYRIIIIIILKPPELTS